MKVKVISRSTDEFTRERSQDLQCSVISSFDPSSLRTQEKAVEYVRALNAAKLGKIFARPFIGALDGHIDAISSMAKNPVHLKGIFSGSVDGGGQFRQFPGHQGITKPRSVPLAVYIWKNAFWAVDRQYEGEFFATAGAQVDIWNHDRSQPVNSFEWGKDTVISIRFNPAEPNLLATSSRILHRRRIDRIDRRTERSTVAARRLLLAEHVVREPNTELAKSINSISPPWCSGANALKLWRLRQHFVNTINLLLFEANYKVRIDFLDGHFVSFPTAYRNLHNFNTFVPLHHGGEMEFSDFANSVLQDRHYWKLMGSYRSSSCSGPIDLPPVQDPIDLPPVQDPIDPPPVQYPFHPPPPVQDPFNTSPVQTPINHPLVVPPQPSLASAHVAKFAFLRPFLKPLSSFPLTWTTISQGLRDYVANILTTESIPWMQLIWKV
ncbi:Unknown protein [Striga hermonthica]|uniref:Uncharacterized protein n=1 Tax=Striga hermonthica TaxID=68872 RepID=A0A9N7NMX2_STRHE|nr:Unknown protein [Striga hermonthica]